MTVLKPSKQHQFYFTLIPIMQYGYHKDVDPRKPLVVAEIFRRVNSSLMWASWFDFGCGILRPCQEAEMPVGPPRRGKPFLLCHGLGLGLMLHWQCPNFMPHNRGTPPLAWPRLCDSRAPPKPEDIAPGTMRHMTMAAHDSGPHLSMCSRPRHTESGSLPKILILPFASSVTFGQLCNLWASDFLSLKWTLVVVPVL